MADPIPTTDAAILAAQAASGQAGVEAYKKSKAELEAQRKRALAQAQAEAMARGAPAGAVQQVAPEVSGAYDRRIANLTEQQGMYQQAMSARERRMDDYNSAVLAARDLIENQSALAVAPINAQSDYQIRRLQQEGQNKVDEINAQIRLEQARREAAALAAARSGGGGGRGGGGGGSSKKESLGKLGDSDLREAMRASGELKVQQARQAVAKTASGNQMQWQRDTAARTAATSPTRVSGIASWMNKAIDRVNASRATSSSSARAAFEANTGQTSSAALRAAAAPPMLPKIQPVGSSQASEAARRAFEQNTGQTSQSTGRTGWGSAAPSSILNPNQRIMLRQTEYGPILSDLLGNAGGNIQSTGDIDRLLYGAPSQTGEIDPRAPEAMRQAMMLAALDLADQGYEITLPEVQNALAGEYEGETYLDLQQRRAGLPSVRDQLAEADEAAAAAADARAAATRQAESDYRENTRFNAWLNEQDVAYQEGIDQEELDAAEAETRNIIATKTGGLRPEDIDANPDDILEILTPGTQLNADYTKIKNQILNDFDVDEYPTSGSEWLMFLDDLDINPVMQPELRPVIALLQAEMGV